MSNLNTKTLVAVALVVCCLTRIQAQPQSCPLGLPGEIFCDDFNDGDATDGMPGTWVPSIFVGGTRDASSGDLVVTHTGGARTQVLELTGLRNGSFHTQLNFSQVNGPDSNYAHINVRSGGGAGEYVGGIENDGTIFISRFLPASGITTLDIEDTNLDPVGGDVLLQFDVFEDQLSLTAWQAGLEKPATPQLTATDNNVTEGADVSLHVSRSGSGPASVTFRYFAAVPEPSVFALSATACVALLGLTRRRIAE